MTLDDSIRRANKILRHAIGVAWGIIPSQERDMVEKKPEKPDTIPTVFSRETVTAEGILAWARAQQAEASKKCTKK